MAEPIRPVLLHRNANHRRSTEIYSLGDSHVWVREHKDLSPQSWQAPPEFERVGKLVFSAGRCHEGKWFHTVEASTSIHPLFQTDLDGADPSLPQLLSDLGEGAFRFEQTQQALVQNPVPAVVAFLLGWKSSLDDVEGSAQIHAELVAALGAEWFKDLEVWYLQETVSGSRHGEFSVANITLSPTGPVVLRDPVSVAAPRGFDVGWLIGDFIEFAMSPLTPFSARDAAAAARLVRQGYERAASQTVSSDDQATEKSLKIAAQLRIIYHYVEYRLHPELDQVHATNALDLICPEVLGEGGSVLSFVLCESSNVGGQSHAG